MDNRQHDVFLSHNSADKPVVEELARRLVREGIQPWLDTWNLIPGSPWQEAIEAALDNCATCAVFVGPSGTGPWQNEEMRAVIDRRVSESQGLFRVIPVLLPGAERGERSRLPTFLAATTWVEFRRTLDDEDAVYRLICGIRGVEPGPGHGLAIYEGVNPYRGLQVFDVPHAPFFFGREALIEWLLNALRPATGTRPENRFLGIIGPSGSGKSSLARAGLIAALKRGELAGSQDWSIAIFKSGHDPLESLAIALCDATGIRQEPQAVLKLIGTLREDERTLHLTTRLALRDAPSDRRLILMVDQFEEVFTLCREESLRRKLIDNLLYASSVIQGQTIVLLTLRADFYGKCAAYPALAAALSDHQVLVGSMTRDELERAIERPALLAGCEFEAGLVETLLDDVQGQSGSLPLLQYALLEMWNRRVGRRLTHASYRAIGGVEGALERRADAIYAGFSEQEQAICRRIFLRLTQPGEGTEDTKRRTSLQELLPIADDQATFDAVIQTLAGADARLITTHGGEEREAGQFVEVAHEALIRSWPRLRRWIDQNRAALRIHRQLTERAEEWDRMNRDEGGLYRGAQLASALEWAERHGDDLNTLERTFLDASLALRDHEIAMQEAQQQRELSQAQALAIEQQQRAEAERQRAEAQQRRAEDQARAGRWLRVLALVLTVVTLLALAAAVFAGREQQRAQNAANAQATEVVVRKTAEAKALEAQATAEAARTRAEKQTRTATSRRLAAQSLTLLGDQSALALLLSIEAYRTDNTAEARSSLLSALEYDPRLISFLRGHYGNVSGVAFSPDGKTLASGSWDWTVILWDIATGKPLMPPLEGHTDSVLSIAFSPDGKTLASGSGDKAIILWDVATGKPLGSPFQGSIGSVEGVAFSPDGKTLASASSNGDIILWDVMTRQPSTGVTFSSEVDRRPTISMIRVPS